MFLQLIFSCVNIVLDIKKGVLIVVCFACALV